MYKSDGLVNKKSRAGNRQWLRTRRGLKSIFFKDQSPTVPPMKACARHIVTIAALALAATILGGCSSINERLAPAVGEAIPQWAGGLPKDVPPRRGTPEYDAYMQERERRRLEPAPSNANASAPAQLEPVH
jgi:hypothetical protein